MLTYEEWQDQTKVARVGNDKFPKVVKTLTRLDEAAKDFLNPASSADERRATAKDLQVRLSDWKRAMQVTGRVHWPPVVDRLAREIVYWRNYRAIRALGIESIRVMIRYAEYMPSDYLESLRTIFQFPANPTFINCRWYDDDASFERDYTELTKGKPAYPAWGVKAYCLPKPGDDVNYPLKSDATTVPASRVIALRPDLTEDIACHELHHWCTHDAYENMADTYRTAEGGVKNTLIEGVTEYFTRPLCPGRTSYNDELEMMRSALSKGVCTEDELANAYFGGREVTTVGARLADFFIQTTRQGEAAVAIAVGKSIAVTMTASFWYRVGQKKFSDWRPELQAYIRSVVDKNLEQGLQTLKQEIPTISPDAIAAIRKEFK